METQVLKDKWVLMGLMWFIHVVRKEDSCVVKSYGLLKKSEWIATAIFLNILHQCIKFPVDCTLHSSAGTLLLFVLICGAQQEFISAAISLARLRSVDSSFCCKND